MPMNIPVSPVVLVTLILSAWATHAHADPVSGTDAALSGIDTSKVRVGASVTIVYGLGYRDPLSGEWPKLAIAKGTIQAVDGERVLLALEGRDSVQRIDLERIQGFDLADAPSDGGTMEVVDTAAVGIARPKVEREEHRWRVSGKLIAGMIGGVAFGFLMTGSPLRWRAVRLDCSSGVGSRTPWTVRGQP